MTISLALTGCGQPDGKTGHQEMAVSALSSDMSSPYA